MSDSDLPSDSHHPTPQENQDGSERAASEVQDNPSPAAADSDMDMDRDDGGASDNDSELSDVDEAAFADFDPNSVALADRPVAIDEEITRGLKASKIKRTDRESKKKEAKRDKSKKKRRREEDEDASAVEEVEGKRSRKTKRTTAGRSSRTDPERVQAQKQKDAIAEENMTAEDRRARALDAAMDAALKNPNKRRRKKDEVVCIVYACLGTDTNYRIGFGRSFRR